ncbi:MAG: class E sortase [Candidatus Peribacteria bacterium]|nr:MAG: class E sortase [Candidatus Peribacteria bacterium]
MNHEDILESIQFDDTNESINIADFGLDGMTMEHDEIRIDDAENITQEIQKNIGNSIVSGIWMLIKYISTSAFIFVLLLVGTNYSAYYNIAKSYFQKEALAETEHSIIESVQASELGKKLEENKQKQEEEEEKVAAVQNDELSPFSMKNIVRKSNTENVQLDIEITPYENRIVIPKIGKNIPLIDIQNKKVSGEGELNDIFMKELENGVIRYPGSATPGNHGNTFIFGHSSNFPWMDGQYNDVFALLDKVVYDDKIVVYYGQKKYTYTIREKYVIKPGDVDVIKRNKDLSEITLMTCWPVGTTLNRLIVVGELEEDA